ncbi:hypothetical protein VOLCADRAFT_95852 [Volvox carteri f. nagariensis]|uniref:Uncharacterized protein n=1 Tax=Volvox carteri f. nagariensis TaxID=3068 RepID=D8U8J6_VOLCA|nr:uncharacterized protein VOLCADRAFT_95852 [Volvox carteri f. nagariensis]EFJ43992.1 hypothetical protein VOLCADRAFT_95852 [Volvox carteri f. nagariensis]|eukprot:XP_002955004.1 hypothetical protein VOLCADRAFT_95852 [Volvox carteri f. nagariensis]
MMQHTLTPKVDARERMAALLAWHTTQELHRVEPMMRELSTLRHAGLDVVRGSRRTNPSQFRVVRRMVFTATFDDLAAGLELIHSHGSKPALGFDTWTSEGDVCASLAAVQAELACLHNENNMLWNKLVDVTVATAAEKAALKSEYAALESKYKELESKYEALKPENVLHPRTAQQVLRLGVLGCPVPACEWCCARCPIMHLKEILGHHLDHRHHSNTAEALSQLLHASRPVRSELPQRVIIQAVHRCVGFTDDVVHLNILEARFTALALQGVADHHGLGLVDQLPLNCSPFFLYHFLYSSLKSREYKNMASCALHQRNKILAQDVNLALVAAVVCFVWRQASMLRNLACNCCQLHS